MATALSLKKTDSFNPITPPKSLSQEAILSHVVKKCFAESETPSTDSLKDGLTCSGKYKLITVLGRGTFGVVLLATDGSQNVVIKITRKSRHNCVVKQEYENLWRVRSIDPCHTVMPLSSRSIKVISSKDPSKFYERVVMVSTYGGQSLLDYFINKRSALSIEGFVSIGFQLLLYYQALRKENLVQGDVTVGNVLINDNPLLKGSITFIDAAEIAEHNSEQTNYHRTSPWYRSISVLKGKVLGREMLVSIGAILFEIVTCIPLFQVEIKDSESSRQEMSRLIQKVYRILGEPPKSFLDSIPLYMRDKFFSRTFHPSTHEFKLSLIHSLKDKYTPKTHQRDYILSLMKEKTSNMLGKSFDEDDVCLMSDLIYTLINVYEDCPSPETLLDAPLFRKFSPVVQVHLDDDAGKIASGISAIGI